MKREDLDKPFSVEEREKLLKQPCLNDMVKELSRGHIDPSKEGMDYRLWCRDAPDVITLANLNYSGKGVKFTQLELDKGGVEFLDKRLYYGDV